MIQRNSIIGAKKFILHEDINRLDTAIAHKKRYKYIISNIYY